MDLSLVKVLASIAIFLSALLGGALPFWLKARQHSHSHSHHDERNNEDREQHNTGADSNHGDIEPTRILVASPSSSSSRLLRSHPSAESKQRRTMDVDRFLSLGNMFSAGIFLGGGLLHLLVESNEGLSTVQSTWPGFTQTFPMAFFFAGMGFFTILCVEEVTIAITKRKEKEKPNENDGATMSHESDQQHNHHPTDTSTMMTNGTSQKLNQNILHGLTPRLALVPSNEHCPAHEPPLSFPLDPNLVEETSSPESDESEAGPIQTFLDAECEYDSPSPFPSLAQAAHAKLHRKKQSKKCRGSQSECDVEKGVNKSAPSRSTLPSLTQPLNNSTSTTTTTSSSSSSPTILYPAPSLPSSSSANIQQQSSSSADDESTHLLGGGPRNKQQQQQQQQHHHQQPHLKIDPYRANQSSHWHAHSSYSYQNHDHNHEHIQHRRNSTEGNHSHLSISSDTSYIVAYLLVIALSLHTIFEGIALGTQSSRSATITIFIVIIAHSPLAGFALGVSLVKSKTSTRLAFGCLLIFTVMAPLGAALGMCLTYTLEGTTLQLVSGVFQAFSAGTFIFVCTQEIIPKEMAVQKDKGAKLALMILGFILMACVKAIDK